jgi:tetratricopeptide (TPR) repeat protein
MTCIVLSGASYVSLQQEVYAAKSSEPSNDLGLPNAIAVDINAGQWTKVLPELEHACVPGKPALPDFWLAFDYVFFGNCDQLKTLTESLEGSSKDQPSTTVKLIQVANLTCQSKYNEATQMLNSINEPADNPGKVALQFMQAMVASKQGQYAQAVEHLQKAVATAPNFVWGYRTLGYVQLRSLKEPAAAEESLKKALKLNPDFSEVSDLLVEACLAQSDFDGAIDVAQDAITLSPKNANNYYRLAQIYIQQLRLREAGMKLDKAIVLAPDDAHLYRARGLVFRRQSDFKDAIAVQKKAVELAQNKGPELNELATLNLDAGNTGGAIQNLKDALQADPTSQFLEQRLCRLLNQEQRYDDLVTQVRAMLARKPKDFSISLALARTLKAEGKIDEAIAQYKEAATLAPADARSHEELAAIYLDKKDYPSTIAELTRALNDNPNSVSDLVALGYAYVQNNDYLQAEAAFVTALALQQLTQPAMGPTVPISRIDLMRSLSALYLVESRYPEAVTQFEAITSSERNSRALTEDEFLLSVSRLYRDRTSAEADDLLRIYNMLPAQRKQKILPSVIESLVDTHNLQQVKDLIAGVSVADLKNNAALALVVSSYRYANSDADGAVTLLNNALAGDIEDTQLRSDMQTELSRILLKKKDLAGAEDAAIKALEANPKSFKACAELARVYKAKNDLSNAARTCREGIELNPYYAPVYVCYGDILLAQKDSAQAEDQYKRASELYPAWDVPRNRLHKVTGSNAAPKNVRPDESTNKAKKATKPLTSLTVHGKSYKLAPDQVEVPSSPAKVSPHPNSIKAKPTQNHAPAKPLAKPAN